MLKGIGDYEIHNEHPSNGAMTHHIVIGKIFHDL